MKINIYLENNESLTPLTLSNALIGLSISDFSPDDVDFIREVSKHLKVYYKNAERMKNKKRGDKNGSL